MITIRPLEEKDVTAVSEIESRTFSMPWKEKDFLEMVKADYAYYYAVDAPFRRRGIAGKLLAHALKEAAEHGIGDCTLEVRVSNTPAIHLYEEFGFRGEGIRPDFYEKPKEDALIMWKR